MLFNSSSVILEYLFSQQSFLYQINRVFIRYLILVGNVKVIVL